ncbi:hypothetical protein [Bacillus dakarensis]|uniref:hypothetical protein n=1 Tax=Robertmurraya dakarensis TaxID=1926278 RepID=UPI00098115D5|nr:hypothetical protein [Bacillus dakarensis]
MLNHLHFKVFLILSLSIFTSQTEGMSANKVIEGYFNDINESRWSSVHSWYVNERAMEIKSFIENEENQEKKLGLLNIIEARLVNLKELPYDYADNFIPNRYMEQYDNKDKKAFYAAVDYTVYHEDQYHINGVNYFLVVLVLEDNHWRIALTPHVPVNAIVSDGFGFGTKDEKTFDERRQKFRD